MNLLWFLIYIIVSSTSIESKNIFSCSDQLNKIDCLDIYYCGWCNTSTIHNNIYSNICKNIYNCNTSYEYIGECEYKHSTKTCKVNALTLYIFVLGLLIVCCYMMIVIVYTMLNITNCSKSFPLLFFITPAIMLLAIDENLYIQFVFISVGVYLFIGLGLAYYTHIYR